MPGIGEYILAQDNDKYYYRALVLAVDKHEAKMFFIDFGNIRICKRGELRILPEKLLKIPILAIEVTLKGVKTTCYTASTQKALNYLTDIVVQTKIINCFYDGSILDGVFE